MSGYLHETIVPWPLELNSQIFLKIILVLRRYSRKYLQPPGNDTPRLEKLYLDDPISLSSNHKPRHVGTNQP